MTQPPEQIAKALTPAQVRALRDPGGNVDDWNTLMTWHKNLLTFDRGWRQSDLGRAVLAVLDKGVGG